MLGEKTSLGEVQEILAKHGVSVLSTMTTPTRPGKAPRPVWVVGGDVYGLENFLREGGCRKFRGAWSCFENPSSALAEHLELEGRQVFAEQIEAKLERKSERQERFEQYAENACLRSDAAYEKAHTIGSHIPMGQPILVGHHSEGRHRRDLKRIDRNMQKSIEESKKADYYRDKADNLARDQKAPHDRQYIANRITEVKREINSMTRYAELTTSESVRENTLLRLSQASEKLQYWEMKLSQISEIMESAGVLVPSPETIDVGDEIFYINWLPVVRVNRKTVTVSHWLNVPSFTYKIEYTRITNVRKAQTLSAAANEKEG